MLLAMTVAGAIAGAGLLLLARGAVGQGVPLAAVVAELHRPRVAEPPISRRDAVVAQLAGRSSQARERDLAACERTIDRYVQDRLVWAALGVSPGAALLVLSAGGAMSVMRPVGLMAAMVLGAFAGWF